MKSDLIEKQTAETANSVSNETFFEAKKSESKVKIDYCTSEQSIVKVTLDELITHPLNLSLYSDADSSRIKFLAQNIKDHSLINRIIVNKNLEILSGNLRHKALKYLKVNEIEVYVKDIKKEDELEFIIAANHQREKTILDARNEIMSLFDKYSPGQGNRETKGENTIKKISNLTGYSTNKISTIRKIETAFPSILIEVSKGNMTLNNASKQCDVVSKIKDLSDMLGEDLLKDLPVEKIDETFDKGVKTYCKKSQPEYFAMLSNNEMSTSQAYNKLFPDKKTKDEDTSENSHNHNNGFADDSMYCPCCAQRLKKDNKEIGWLKKWDQTIKEYIANLKLPTNE